MFRLDDNFTEADLTEARRTVESNYVLKANDILLLDVFTNKGEHLLDPNRELQTTNIQVNQRDKFQYVVQHDGTVTFPLVGEFDVKGLTLAEAELKLVDEFDNIYKNSFVKLRIANRRAFVLGVPGGKIVPIQNENTDLLEILATAGGLDLGAKAHNIRLIRGDLVYRIDLSTISGMKETNMIVEPYDVIYIEPWRRPWLEALRDISPALSLVTSALTLIVVVQNLK